MKRFHINLNVKDLDKSILFYNTLFQAEPTVLKHDYAKWMLEDPRINFSINDRLAMPGVNHLGLQAESADEFADIEQRLAAADAEVFDEGEATCCYAKSTKAWIRDPDGNSWETFITHGEVTTYNGQGEELVSESETKSACCTPESEVKAEAALETASCC